MGRLLTLIILLVSSSAQAVCLTELYGEFYGCKSMAENKSAVKWCKKKYGEDYLPYYTTNVCSKSLAFEARGEVYKPTNQDKYGTVKASCMTYETSQKYSCEYYDYEPAQRYCSMNYGNKYLAFYPEGKCTMAQASTSRNEVSPKKLINGLASMMDEAEAIMTSIDRQGVESSMGGIASTNPKIGAEFYTTPIKRIMATMNTLKGKLLENSHLKVNLLRAQAEGSKKDLQYIRTFLQYNFRYLALLGRLYRVYAYVAHLNHYVLKSYDFKNLEYLNLKLKKDFALEILSRVNYMVLTKDGGKNLEFQVGQQDRQTYEYMAIENPQTKTNYAKLLVFMGARENITNQWAVQRLTTTDIQDYKVNSCGKGFLSLRSPNDNMMNSTAVQELWDYDVFYGGYLAKWEKLVDASWEVNILTSMSKANNLAYWTYKQVPELKSYLQNEIQNPITSDEGFKEFSVQDGEMLLLAEKETWKSFSNDHFTTIVMPGDGVRNINKIIKRIVSESYNKRVQAMADTFQGAYPFISNKGLNGVSAYIKRYADKYLKEDFEKRLSEKLRGVLAGYNDSSMLRPKNRKEKIDEMMEAVKVSVRAAYVQDRLDKKYGLNDAKLLDPTNIEELMMLFEHKLQSYYDLSVTLRKDAKKAEKLKEFFTEVTNRFQEKFIKSDGGMSYSYVGTDDERAKGLREIFYQVAQEYYKKYPYTINNMMTHQLRDEYVAVQDNTRVATPTHLQYIPVYEDGTPAILGNDDFINTFDTDLAKKYLDKYKNNDSYLENYVAVQDNTYVHRTNILLGINDQPIGKKSTEKRVVPGYNKDKITTGEIGKPLMVTDKGDIKTPRGVIPVSQEEIYNILKRVEAFSPEAMKKFESKNSTQKNRKIVYERFDIHKHVIADDREFFYRIFSMMNVHTISLSNTWMGGHFAPGNENQRFLAQNRVAQAYQTAPMLRNEYEWTHTYYQDIYHTDSFGVTMYAGKKKRTKTYREPLLVKIATTAYNASSGKLNESKARQLIDDIIKRATNNTAGKVAKFCNANWVNYKNDTRFKDVFKASSFLRATLKSPYAGGEEQAERIGKFDEEIRKELRSRWKAFNEDYVEPALKILGTAALIALAVVLIIGSAGTAAPGVLGGAYAIASTFLAVEFFISFPLVVSSLYTRINTHFYEVPAQLKFQRSLAQSQINFSEVVDWDMLRAEEKANKSSKAWTIGLMPLDFIYGAALLKHVRTTTGVVGRNAFRRLTNVKLRGWSAPPKSMLVHSGRFKDLRKAQGFIKATRIKVKQFVTNAKMYLPKYQPLPPEMLKGLPLRMGLLKRAKEIGVASKPWALLDDIKAYHSKLKGRIKEFDHFVATESGVLGKVRLEGKLGFREVMDHGLQYSSLSFIPKSYAQAFKHAVKTKDPGYFVKFLTDNQTLWAKLKHMQGTLVQTRATNIAKTMDKIEDFKKAVDSGQIAAQGDELMGELLRRLDTDEILVLQEIAKNSKGMMGNFKSIFKDYNRVISGLKPVQYLYGKAGVQFNPTAVYQNVIMGDLVSDGYKYKNATEDLVNYYESMMKQHGNLSDELMRQRREVENVIGQNMIVDNKGVRKYLD